MFNLFNLELHLFSLFVTILSKLLISDSMLFLNLFNTLNTLSSSLAFAILAAAFYSVPKSAMSPLILVTLVKSSLSSLSPGPLGPGGALAKPSLISFNNFITPSSW